MYEKHVFVCTNHKGEGRNSCGARGSIPMCDQLKAAAKSHPALADKRVRINKSGCLGLCDEGPTIVVYPEGVWYTGVQASDLTEILERHIVGGEPVARLRAKNDPASST